MNLKQRFSLLFSSLFSLLLAAVMLVVYYLFSDFRQEEFRQRLAEKGETTVRLLLDVKEVDHQLLRIIDENSIHKLYNEKTLIFNDSMQLIYSSIDDATIDWDKEELKRIKEEKQIFRRTKEYEVMGMYYDSEEKDYYVLIAAEDKYGNSKLRYLRYLLLGAFLFGTVLVWSLSFYLSKRSLEPLDVVRKRIQEITDKSLNTRIEESGKNDEMQALSRSFNQMMDRIDNAYSRQKEFTGNASHELRTPITRMLAQLENLLHQGGLAPETEAVVKNVMADSYQLSDIVSSLLLLSEMENKDLRAAFKPVRLDELVFHTASQLSRLYPDFKLQFAFDASIESNSDVEIRGDETLLKIALTNLLKNAYAYSDDKVVACTLKKAGTGVALLVSNTGEVPDVKETMTLFNSFTRGSNTRQKPGSGLGLSIVQRIIHYHEAMVSYHLPGRNINEVVIQFPA